MSFCNIINKMLSDRREKEIIKDINRIKELGLSGEDTLKMACSLINALVKLNKEAQKSVQLKR